MKDGRCIARSYAPRARRSAAYPQQTTRGASRLTGLDRVGARKLLHQVVDEGKLTQQGDRRWTHDIRIEQLIPSIGAGTPHLVGGARACPPEDCGGPGGYEELLEALADPGHEQHEHLLGWVGGSFDPDAFDLAETNANLELYDRHTRQRRMRAQ